MDPKKLAAERAVTYIKDGMTVGLGTGSTAYFAIEALGKMVKEGLRINAVASSVRSEELAKNAGIRIAGFSEIDNIDMYIDGADEVDKDLNLIKGGGGALLREKILASDSKEFIVIVDSSKLVDHLGKFPLPVEVTPFANELTKRRLEKLGCMANVRSDHQKIYITDNGNMIIDCAFNKIIHVDRLHDSINAIAGVVDNGLFQNNIVNKLLVGYENGKVKLLEPGQRPGKL